MVILAPAIPGPSMVCRAREAADRGGLCFPATAAHQHEARRDRDTILVVPRDGYINLDTPSQHDRTRWQSHRSFARRFNTGRLRPWRPAVIRASIVARERRRPDVCLGCARLLRPRLRRGRQKNPALPCRQRRRCSEKRGESRSFYRSRPMAKAGPARLMSPVSL